VRQRAGESAPAADTVRYILADCAAQLCIVDAACEALIRPRWRAS